MHWNTVWAIISAQLEKYILRARDLRKLRWISIDEIFLKKHHNYLTVVVDHASGRVVHVTKGRGEQIIYAFFKRLGRLRVPLEVVTSDMWPPYFSVMLKFFPSVHIVYDKFHIISNPNRKIDELRRKEYYLNKKN